MRSSEDTSSTSRGAGRAPMASPGQARVITTRSQDDEQDGARKSPRSIGCTLGLCLVLLVAPVGAQETPPTSPSPGRTTAGSSNGTAAPSATTTAAPTTTLASALSPNETSFEPTAGPVNAAAAQQHKLRPINFTLVEELFESTVNESEQLRHWRAMDGQFQEGIRSILKLVFPQIVSISQDAKVSGDCSGGILKWILSLRNLRSWAIKMLDATGKPTAGIFEGSLTMFGNHRQCLSIRAPDEDEIEITDQFEEYFRGQFCVLHLRPWLSAKKPFYHLNSSVEPLLRKGYKYYEKTLYDELAEIAVAFNFIDIRMDLCVPSTCTMADIQRVADLLSKKLEMRAKVMRCDIESRESSVTFVQNLDQTTVAWLAGPACLVLITLLATILVPFRRGAPDTDWRAGQSRGLTPGRLLYCLSLQGALNNLLACPRPTYSQSIDSNSTTNNNDQSGPDRAALILKKPLPLYGLRNLFVVWFVVVQLTVELKYQYLRESLVLRNMMLAYWPLQVIINTSMIFESLILITAFTYGYSTLHTTAKGLLGYIATKYVRLVPSIATLVTATIVLPSIGITSPVWRNFVEAQSGVCKSTGYLDLFFLQNLVAYDKICLPHTWLFCVELQLIALSIPLVLLLQRTPKRDESSAMAAENDQDLAAKSYASKRHPDTLKQLTRRLLTSKTGLLGLALLLVGAAGNFALVYTNQLPPAWFHTFPDSEQKKYYFGAYLTKASTHLTTFLVGLYAGHLTRASVQHRLAQASPAEAGSAPEAACKSAERDTFKCQRAGLQLAALACLASVVFVTFSWSTQELPSPFVAALYDSAGRLVWSLALVGLMVQLCRPNGKGAYSGVARVFSRPASVVLGRLSFLAYLSAPLVHTFVLAVQEQSLFPSLYLIFHVMLGNIVITYLLAFVLSLLIEQPIRLALRQLLASFGAGRTSGCATISERSAANTAGTSVTSLAG